MNRLRAFEVGEERQLAGVVAGLLWICAGYLLLRMRGLTDYARPASTPRM